jgi:hypothetical protein
MIIDDLNTLLPSPKLIHIIKYTKDLTTVPNDYDFAYNYLNNKTYQKVNNTWDLIPDDISFMIMDNSVGMAPPDGYNGVAVNGVLDKVWPPSIRSGNIYITDDWQLLYNLTMPKQGEFLIMGDDTFLLNIYPHTSQNSWLKLLKASSHSGSWWDKTVANIDKFGTIELGKNIDFHCNISTTDDFSYRITNTSEGMLELSGELLLKKLTIANDNSILSLKQSNGEDSWDIISNTELSFMDTLTNTIPIIIKNDSIDISVPINVNNISNLYNDVNIIGKLMVAGELDISQKVALQNDVEIFGNLNIMGLTTFNQDIEIIGNIIGNGHLLSNIDAENISIGKISYDRLPIGDVENTVADGLHNHDLVYQAAYPWKIISGDYSAENGDRLLIDSSIVSSINLPSGKIGHMIIIKDMMANLSSNNLSIYSGSLINGSNNDLVISENSAYIVMVYTNSIRGWIVL